LSAAEEREAITLGVRATIMDVLAGGDITIVEIDFRNPAEWPGRAPAVRPDAGVLDALGDCEQAELGGASHDRP
jgi:hypothetical protein